MNFSSHQIFLEDVSSPEKFYKAFNKKLFARENYICVASQILSSLEDQRQRGVDLPCMRLALLKMAKCEDAKIKHLSFKLLGKSLVNVANCDDGDGLLKVIDKLSGMLVKDNFQYFTVEKQKDILKCLYKAINRYNVLYSVGKVNKVLELSNKSLSISKQKIAENFRDDWYLNNNDKNIVLRLDNKKVYEAHKRLHGNLRISNVVLSVLKNVAALMYNAIKGNGKGAGNNLKSLISRFRTINIKRLWYEQVICIENLQTIACNDEEGLYVFLDCIKCFTEKKCNWKVFSQAILSLKYVIRHGKKFNSDCAFDALLEMFDNVNFTSKRENRIVMWSCISKLMQSFDGRKVYLVKVLLERFGTFEKDSDICEIIEGIRLSINSEE